MRPAWLIATAVLAAALAGCSDGGGNGAEGPSGGGPDGLAAPALQVPTWQVGDWWTYEATFGTWTLVVTEETGTHYIVDTTDADLAFFHAAFEPGVSYVGPISKADLGGDQSGARVEFFDFPLEDGKTWRTDWDGTQYDMIAHQVGPETFHVQAKVGDVVVNQIQFSNETRWFDWVSWGDENGTEMFRIDLVESGRGFSGEVVRIHPEEVVSLSGSGPGQESTVFGEWMTEDADLYAIMQFACTQGAFAFAMGPAENIPGLLDAGVEPNDDGYNFAGPCPDTDAYTGVIGEHPDMGTWGYVLASASPDATWSVQAWLRHYERIQV